MWAPFLWNGFVFCEELQQMSPGPKMSRKLWRSASSREANCPLARRGYRSLVSFTSPCWSKRALLVEIVLSATVVFRRQIFAALVNSCLLATHIVAVNGTIYHWDFLTFCLIFPFHAFLVCFFVTYSRGLRVFGVSRLGLVLLVEHWRKSTEMYCLHRARPSSGSEIQREEKNVRVKTASVYVRPQCTSCLLASGAAWFGLAAEQAGEYVLRHGHWKGYSWFFACSQSCLCEALLAPNRSSSVYPALVHTSSYAGRQGRFSKIFKGTGYSAKPGISYEGFVRYGHSRITNGLKSGPEPRPLSVPFLIRTSGKSHSQAGSATRTHICYLTLMIITIFVPSVSHKWTKMAIICPYSSHNWLISVDFGVKPVGTKSQLWPEISFGSSP